MITITKSSKIYIAGHNGMVGSSCWREFKNNGYLNIVGKSSKELDLKNQLETDLFFKKEKPEIVINAAAKVGGIYANDNYPYEFLMNNMLIQNNLIKSSFEHGVKKFIFLGSSCIYPKFSSQPIKEDMLLTSSLESTNQWYSIAKISGVKLIEALKKQYKKDFISLMPTNLYGPGDNYDLKTSHVLPAMIRKFHEAKVLNHKRVTLWGSGTPLREFLHVNDLSKAVLFSMQNELQHSIYNVGSGIEISINELANKIKKIIGFKGEINWDSKMPDGTKRKLLDSTRINELGWKPEIELEDGINDTYQKYIKSNY